MVKIINQIIAIVTVLAVSFPAVSFGAAAPRLRSVTQMRVFDSTGKVVGPVLALDIGSSAVVGFKVGNFTFPLMVTQERLVGSTNEVAMFTTPNCSGTAYIDPSEANLPFPPLLPTVAVGQKRIYVQNGPIQSTTIVSNLSLITPGSTCNSFPLSPDLRPVVPAVLVIDDLDTQFIAPFTVE